MPRVPQRDGEQPNKFCRCCHFIKPIDQFYLHKASPSLQRQSRNPITFRQRNCIQCNNRLRNIRKGHNDRMALAAANAGLRPLTSRLHRKRLFLLLKAMLLPSVLPQDEVYRLLDLHKAKFEQELQRLQQLNTSTVLPTQQPS